MEADQDITEIKTETPMENQDLTSLLQHTVGAFLGEYGWYLLFLSVGLYFLIQHLTKQRSRPDDDWSGRGIGGDTLEVVRRQEALEASRRRMQEELDAKAAQYKEKQQALEEEKRKQKIEMWESMQQGKSYQGNPRVSNSTEEASTSTVVKPKSDKKRLRSSGFNPLSGEGGGACVWRPGRRGPSAGG